MKWYDSLIGAWAIMVLAIGFLAGYHYRSVVNRLREIKEEYYAKQEDYSPSATIVDADDPVQLIRRLNGEDDDLQ